MNLNFGSNTQYPNKPDDYSEMNSNKKVYINIKNNYCLYIFIFINQILKDGLLKIQSSKLVNKKNIQQVFIKYLISYDSFNIYRMIYSIKTI